MCPNFVSESNPLLPVTFLSLKAIVPPIQDYLIYILWGWQL